MSKELQYVGHDLLLPTWIWQDENLNLAERVLFALAVKMSKKQSVLLFQPLALAKTLGMLDKSQKGLNQAIPVCITFQSLLNKGYIAKVNNVNVHVKATTLQWKVIKEERAVPRNQQIQIENQLF